MPIDCSPLSPKTWLRATPLVCIPHLILISPHVLSQIVELIVPCWCMWSMPQSGVPQKGMQEKCPMEQQLQHIDETHQTWGKWVHHRCHGVVQFSWHPRIHLAIQLGLLDQVRLLQQWKPLLRICLSPQRMPTVIILVPCEHAMHGCSSIKSVLGPCATPVLVQFWWLCTCLQPAGKTTRTWLTGHPKLCSYWTLILFGLLSVSMVHSALWGHQQLGGCIVF